MFKEAIERLKRVEIKSNRLTTELGLGENITQIIENILNDNIKEEYKILVNSIVDEVVTKIEWINNIKLQKFIFENKQEDTYERAIQSVINLYEQKQLTTKIINSIINMLGKNKFTEYLNVSLEIALVNSVYDEIRNKINLRYRISEELEYRCYQVAISTYGLYFIYSNLEELTEYKSKEAKYGKLLDNMLSNGLFFDEDRARELTILFGSIIKFKEQDRYAKYISSKNIVEYKNILKQLDSLESLIQAGFDEERRDFWKDYLLAGEFTNMEKAQVLVIKFEEVFIIEQGLSMGFAYILDNNRYGKVMEFLGNNEIGYVKTYLNRLRSDFTWNEKTLTHNRGVWQYKFRKELSSRNIFTDKSMRDEYNRIKDERRKMTPSLRYKILVRDGYTCYYCKQLLKKERFHVDHKFPISRGGKTEESNLVAACVECNLGKGAKTAEEFMLTRHKKVSKSMYIEDLDITDMF